MATPKKTKDGKGRIHIRGGGVHCMTDGILTRPVNVAGMILKSMTEGAFLLGDETTGRLSTAIPSGVYKGEVVSYATIEEALTLDGAFRDESLDTSEPLLRFRKKYALYFGANGKVRCRFESTERQASGDVIIAGGRFYPSKSAACEGIGVWGSNLTEVLKNGEYEGTKVHVPTMEEALEYNGTFRDVSLDNCGPNASGKRKERRTATVKEKKKDFLVLLEEGKRPALPEKSVEEVPLDSFSKSDVEELKEIISDEGVPDSVRLKLARMLLK